MLAHELCNASNGLEEKKEAARTSNKIKNAVIKVIQFIANPRFLLCFGLAWIITNGWSYILFGIGTALNIGWMVAVSGAYLAFLWLPVSPEKIVTVAIAMGLLRFLFPHDQKTLAVLKSLYAKAKEKMKRKDTKTKGAIRKGVENDKTK